MDSKLEQLEKFKIDRERFSLPPETPKPRQNKGGLVAGLGILAIILSKFKGLLFLLLGKLKFIWVFLQFLKLSKFLLTFGSMWATILLYSRYYGFEFAFGFVVLILIHELGHGYAAKKVGLPVGAPIFIPFFGAFIALKEFPKTKWINCVVGAGGPIFGLLGGLVVLLLGLSNLFPSRSALFVGIAYFTFHINFFNLMPVFGLDGDRISDPISSRKLLVLGALIIAMAYLISHHTPYHHPTMLIVGGLLFLKSFRSRSDSLETQSKLERLQNLDKPDNKSDSTPKEQWLAFAIFFGLACSLASAAALSAFYIK